MLPLPRSFISLVFTTAVLAITVLATSCATEREASPPTPSVDELPHAPGSPPTSEIADAVEAVAAVDDIEGVETFGVGYRRLLPSDVESDLDLHVWYPTAEPDDDTIEYGVTVKDGFGAPGTPLVVGHASADAPPDAAHGPFPLVVFSHGYSLSPALYAPLLEHLTAEGFVVVAPEHDERLDPELTTMWQALVDRPVLLARTLDAVEALAATDPDLAGVIDTARVAVVGHSYGGYAALAVGGARLDLAGHGARCAALAADDPRQFLCAPVLPHVDDLAARAGLDTPPARLWPSVVDPRVDAVVSMAGDAYLFGPDGLADLHVPVMAIGGTADTGTPFLWGAQPTFDHAGSTDRLLVGLVGAEHMTFATPCEGQPWLEGHPFRSYFCDDPAWDRREAVDLIASLSATFLDATVRGDADARAALSASAIDDPRLIVESTFG